MAAVEGIRINQEKQGRLQDAGLFPKVILIDTISYCNLRCTMCVHSAMQRPKGIMPLPLFRKIIDEIAATDKNVRVWLVFFGEALLLKRKKPTIFELITYAKSKGLTDVVLNSNANLLDAEAARQLITSGLDAIYIGLDAFKAETYRKIRTGGDFEKTVKQVLQLMALKKSLDVTHPRVVVQFVEMPLNSAEKDDFIRFWNGHGATVKIRPMVSWAGKITAPNLTLDQEERWPCYWAMQTLSVTHEGAVVNCAVDLDARFVAGDLTKASIKEIWNGPLKRLRDLHAAKEFAALPEICCNCRDWQSARAEYSEARS